MEQIMNEQLNNLWSLYHELSSAMVLATNEGMDDSKLKTQFEDVCTEIEILSERQ
jgi:hypothetical protein